MVDKQKAYGIDTIELTSQHMGIDTTLQGF